jgi:hypothetical protein
MANLNPSVRVNNRGKKGGAKVRITREQYIDAEQWNNVRDFGLRILHHNVQEFIQQKE